MKWREKEVLVQVIVNYAKNILPCKKKMTKGLELITIDYAFKLFRWRELERSRLARNVNNDEEIVSVMH